MLKQIETFLNLVDTIIWGPPLLILLVGTGIYLTWKLKLLQIFRLPLAIKYIFSKEEDNDESAKGDVSSFGAYSRCCYSY